MPNIKKAKKQASLLAEYLTLIGKDIDRTQALEAVARMRGFKCWNTFQANKEPETESQSVLPAGYQVNLIDNFADSANVQNMHSALAARSVASAALLSDCETLAAMIVNDDISHVTLDGIRFELRYYNSEALDSLDEIRASEPSVHALNDVCLEFERVEGGSVFEATVTVQDVIDVERNRNEWIFPGGSKMVLFVATVMSN